MEKIKVKICEDGIHGMEINPLQEEWDNVQYRNLEAFGDTWTKVKTKQRYREAESSLRTFEIDLPEDRNFNIGDFIKTNSLGIIKISNRSEIQGAKSHAHIIKVFEPNSIHTAELLENGKVKIID